MKRLLLLFSGVFVAAAVATAQPASLGAPDWVRPGLQLTYHLSYAAVGFGVTLEPDEHGNWKDSQGNTYGEREPGRSSGQALCEVNVAHVDPQQVAFSIYTYGIDSSSGALIPPQTSGAHSAAHTGSDFWMHPALLRGLRSQPELGVRVLRGPYRLGERTLEAVTLIARRDTGSSVQTFDAATGLLLSMSTDVTKPNSGYAPGPNGTSVPGGGGRNLAQTRFVGQRQLSLPWLDQPVEAAPDLRELLYSGTQAVTTGGGTPPMMLPQRARLRALQSGPGWAVLEEIVEVGSLYGMPSNTSFGTRGSGLGQIGGLWIPPAGLGRLRQGQVLDRNPFTQIQHAVVASDGRQIQIMSSGTLHRLIYTYDLASGLLVGLRLQHQMAMVMMDINLALASR